MISFACPACQRSLSVKDEFAGRRGTCPHCKKPLLVPAVSPETVPVVSVGLQGVSALADETPSEPDAGAGRFDFLGKPQAADELGRLGSYRVLKVLGSGGMGMVLLADDPALKRPVALKVMRPELAADSSARQRFLREAQATAAIDHPHIVHIHQVAEANGVPFIVMPLLKGESLDARLKRDKRLAIADVLLIGKQVAEGLAEAHKNGLVHRDIKPANIWLSGEPGAPATAITVKIVDFGLARAGGDDVHLTKSGAILGTPAYMAPEQARSAQVDFRCDLFSLGAVLYRMLTGELPFRGHDTMGMLLALATDIPEPVEKFNPEVPPALAGLVMRLLAKEPAQRPPSAKAVAEALSEMSGDQTMLLAMPAPKAGSVRKAALPPVLVEAGKRLRAGLWSLRPWAFRRPAVAFAVEGAVLGLLVLLISLAVFRGTPPPGPRHPAPPPEVDQAADHVRRVQAQLVAALKPDENQIDLVHASLLISKLDNPELDVGRWRGKFGRMAQELRQRVPREANDAAKQDALNQYLFTERRFRGFVGFADRSHIYMDKVLDKHEGMAITLSVLYIELGRQIQLALAGVGMPGRFIVKTLPAQGDGQLIDVFQKGKVLSRGEAEEIVQKLTKQPLQESDLTPTTKRQIVVRLLYNLVNVSRDEADVPRMLRYLDTILTIAPGDSDARRIRAQYLAKVGQQ